MKIYWATLSLFCVTSTLIANEKLAEQYIDQYLEENKENLSQEEIDSFSKYREEIISILGISLNNSREIRIEDWAKAFVDSINDLTATTYSGDWMWFGAFPWVYSSTYESWLYLYPNLDVSIYGENGYARKDSNYCSKMNWVWVVREDNFGVAEYQSKFAYSNDEKAWLHFKQRDAEELHCYSPYTRVWKNFGGEMFNWLDILKIDYADAIALQPLPSFDDYKKEDLIPEDSYKPGDVITQGTQIQMRREIIIPGACPVCAPATLEDLLDSSYYCSCSPDKMEYEYYYRSPTTSEIENQQIEGYYYIGEVKYLGSSPYQDPNELFLGNDTVLSPKVVLDPDPIDPTKVSINQEILNQTSTIK